jgi:ribonuclease HII
MIQNKENSSLIEETIDLNCKAICGIDEAGRGALAGPLCVAGALLKKNIKELNDSKKLTEKKREELFDIIINNSEHEIVFIDNKFIDKNGLTLSIKKAIEQIISKISTTQYIMDGNHNFGISNIQTIIKGDALVPAISAASILAKVSRDRLMKSLDSKYNIYEFEKHKGYGTKKHIEKIEKYGYSNLHRQSFKLKKNSKQPETTLF